MRFQTVFAALFLTFAAASFSEIASAQDVAEAKEDMKADKKALKEIQKIQKKWEKAREKGNDEKMAAVDEDLKVWLREQLKDARADAAAAAAEADAAGPKKAASAMTEAEKAEKAKLLMRRTAVALNELQPKFDNGTATEADFKKKSMLIKRCVKLAQRDLAGEEADLEEAREN